MVVRHCSGANAGHTVVTPDGKRHVFSHVGSGAFCNVPTFLSRFFICNPILFRQEIAALNKLGVVPEVYVDPECLVTTFVDMMINQQQEEQRGARRHGSCGVGIHETLRRSKVESICIKVRDLWDRPAWVRSVVELICTDWAVERLGEPIREAETMANSFFRDCMTFAGAVGPRKIQDFTDPIFEGAQGLLLDQNRREYFPHLTPSNTGMANVRELCTEAGIRDGDAYYVSRTYLTRHGAGPLPGWDPAMQFHDETNQPHPWQGNIRFAPLQHPDLFLRCRKDYGGDGFKLVLTHCDQLNPSLASHLSSYGPTRSDVCSPLKRVAI